MAVSGDFLPELFRGTKGLIYFCALRNSKSKLPLGEVAHILTRNINDIKSFREKWDQPEHECGVYYHVATLKPGAARRIKQIAFTLFRCSATWTMQTMSCHAISPELCSNRRNVRRR